MTSEPPSDPAEDAVAAAAQAAASAAAAAADAASVPLRRLRARFPEIAAGATLFAGVAIVRVPPEAIAAVCRFLKEDPEVACTYLSNLHGSHNPDRERPFEVVYNLYAIAHGHKIMLKVEVADGEEIPTLSAVFRTALAHEREAFDLVGIRFAGHPSLERILLPEDWRGHPLRKDYPLEGNPGDHKVYRT